LQASMTKSDPAQASMDFSYDPRHLGEDVKALFAGAASAVVVAPFITKVGLLPLIAALAPSGRIDVVTRWEPLEIRAGVSDPMIIDAVQASGGTVRLLPRLHAKVYCVGDRALVGSANPTGPGLGFTTPANIEALVAATTNEPALSRLFATIDGLASKADRDYAIELVEYAAKLPEGVLATPADHAVGAPFWVPRSMVPSRVEGCYLGTVPDRADYRADLDAIDAPAGLSSLWFRTHVGLMLRQGLIGKIYQECEGLQQFSGIQLMLRIITGAGIATDDEDPMIIWRRILNWFEYYLQTSDSLNGGYSAKR
jgi:hypothetical protein